MARRGGPSLHQFIRREAASTGQLKPDATTLRWRCHECDEWRPRDPCNECGSRCAAYMRPLTGAPDHG